MNTSVNIDLLSILIFLGVFQGFVLSLFFIFKKTANSEANKYQGLMLLALSLAINEQFLNMTGLITRVLPITNTSEPLNLVIGPLLFMYVKKSLSKESNKLAWIHFVIPALYLIYMCFDFVQSNEFKYNSYVNSTHPDWPTLEVTRVIQDDPLGLKQYLNLLTALQLSFYIGYSFIILFRRARELGEKIFKTEDDQLKSLRNLVLHILSIAMIFVVVKLSFRADLGDYFIGLYVAFFTILTSVRVMNDSEYFDRNPTFMDITVRKYRKSSLTEPWKQRILEAVTREFEKERYYTENLASLSDLSKKIGESPHHVSQVINEKLGKNFFELLAKYRIEKAREILLGDRPGKLTIEEVSELVGYNSKTAFNNAFKKITGKTPSEFRNSQGA
ncbi:MAG: helix-turn-helix domain-containing protein [Bacteroidales bacterium]